MEKKMENEMETGIVFGGLWFISLHLPNARNSSAGSCLMQGISSVRLGSGIVESKEHESQK